MTGTVLVVVCDRSPPRFLLKIARQRHTYVYLVIALLVLHGMSTKQKTISLVKDLETIYRLYPSTTWKRNDQVYAKNAVRNSSGYSDETSVDDKQERYLLYYTHSGFGNQFIGIERAAKLALATKRTLVLPPVLPHSSFDTNHLLFPAYTPRPAGASCGPYNNYNKFLQVVETDVQKASNPNIKYPSFMELFGFNNVINRTGLHVVDMKEFAQNPANTNTTSWCKGKNMENVMVPLCRKSKQMPFTGIVSQFQNMCGADRRVAVIGSAFVTKPAGKELGDLNVFDALSNYFLYELLPSQNMMSLLQRVHSTLPLHYTGVAIRFGDYFKFQNCDEPMVKQAYEAVFLNLTAKSTAMLSSTKEKSVAGRQPSNAIEHFVLLSSGHKDTMRCFRHYANKQENHRFDASTVHDVIQQHEDIQALVRSYANFSELDTIYLLLDQILIGMADQIILQRIQEHSHTFHDRIKIWHRNRESLLAKMNRTALPSPSRPM